MKRILLIACLAVAPAGAMAQVDWSIASRVQPPRIMTPAEMAAGRFLSPPPPQVQYYAPVQPSRATNCITNYTREVNGRIIGAYTNCQ